MRGTLYVVLAAFLGLTSCGSMKPEDFKGREPAFSVEEYFQGSTKAWGMFEDRFGDIRRQFTVDIDGTWDGETLTLVEDFVYDDGETERRIWRIRKTGENSYEGEADGVVGVAVGKGFGNALNWQYHFDLKVDDSTWRVHFNDWMFLQPDGVMLNRAVVTKFGFTIGVATIAFKKQGAEEAQSMEFVPPYVAAAE